MAEYKEKFIIINKKHLEKLPVGLKNRLAKLLYEIAPFIPDNYYYVCNQEEPYAQEILKIILAGEDEKTANPCEGDRIARPLKGKKPGQTEPVPILSFWHSADKELPPPDQVDRLVMYRTGDYDLAYWVDPYWRCRDIGRVFPDMKLITLWIDIPPIPSRYKNNILSGRIIPENIFKGKIKKEK